MVECRYIWLIWLQKFTFRVKTAIGYCVIWDYRVGGRGRGEGGCGVGGRGGDGKTIRANWGGG